MSQTDLALLVSVGLLTIGAICVGLAAAWYAGRRYAVADGPGGPDGHDGRLVQPAPDRAGSEATSATDEELTAPRPHVRDRALRVVSLVFLASVAALVALSGSWPETEAAIYLLVAAGTLAVVFLQDVVPDTIPDGVRHWIEAGAALGFLTVLTGLSGGLASPFFVGFFLVVGAAALSRDGLAPTALALVSGLSYGAVGLLVAWPTPIELPVLGLVGFVVVILVLLAFIATVAEREQRRAREAALRLARFDPLTGLYNRSHFFASMERELRLAERAGRGFALLMLDLDGLKPVNDTFGHHYGDRLLQGITEIIQRSVRTTDTPARYGGDEFVILLPDTDAAGAFVVGEKLRRDVAALSIPVNERAVRTSVSIGLVAYPEDGATVEELMAAADSALYEAKRSGKNRIVGYTTRTERVATRMSEMAREPSGRPPAASQSPDASPQGSPPQEARAGTDDDPGQAPWQTRTAPPQASDGGATPIVAPVGTDQPPVPSQPPVPRRRVAMKIQGDPNRTADVAVPARPGDPDRPGTDPDRS